MVDITDAKRRFVERLKRVESATAPELATHFGLTDTAARQHLEALEATGFVRRGQRQRDGRGRPPVIWTLTPAADAVFPDRHAEFSVELIAAIRDATGEDGLTAVVEARAARQLSAYQTRIDPAAPLAQRVQALCALRADEGYLAEVGEEGGVVTLTEHHCPVGDAATACQALCRSELQVFQAVLGDRAVVRRTQHRVAGEPRCTYEISGI